MVRRAVSEWGALCEKLSDVFPESEDKWGNDIKVLKWNCVLNLVMAKTFQIILLWKKQTNTLLVNL